MSPRITNDGEQCPDQPEGAVHVWEEIDWLGVGIEHQCAYCGTKRTTRFVAPDSSEAEAQRWGKKRSPRGGRRQ